MILAFIERKVYYSLNLKHSSFSDRERKTCTWLWVWKYMCVCVHNDIEKVHTETRRWGTTLTCIFSGASTSSASSTFVLLFYLIVSDFQVDVNTLILQKTKADYQEVKYPSQDSRQKFQPRSINLIRLSFRVLWIKSTRHCLWLNEAKGDLEKNIKYPHNGLKIPA